MPAARLLPEPRAHATRPSSLARPARARAALLSYCTPANCFNCHAIDTRHDTRYVYTILPRDANAVWIGVVRAGARLGGGSTRGRCVLVYHYNQPLQPKPLLRHVAQTATATTSTVAKSRNTIWNTIAVRALPACSLPGSHFLRSVARSFALLQATGNHGGAARFQTNEDQ